MHRIVVAHVVALLVAGVVFCPLVFFGILLTTQGKHPAPSDHWVMFGSVAVGTIVGGFCFAAVARRFSKYDVLSLTGMYIIPFLLLVTPTMLTGNYRIPFLLQLPIAIVVIASSVAAGGYLKYRPGKAQSS